MSGTDHDVDDEFEGIYPDLEAAGLLLAAVSRSDHKSVGELRELEMDWWNVAYTLALLMNGVRAEEPAAVEVVEYYMADESGE
jgi:hypothetical protein